MKCKMYRTGKLKQLQLEMSEFIFIFVRFTDNTTISDGACSFPAPYFYYRVSLSIKGSSCTLSVHPVTDAFWLLSHYVPSSRNARSPLIGQILE